MSRSAIALGIVAVLGASGAAAQTAGDQLSRSLHGGFDLPSVPGGPDWSNAIFTKDRAPVCNDADELLGLMKVVAASNVLDAKTANFYHCALASDGLAVEALAPVNKLEALRQQTFQFVAVRWSRSDGTIDAGYMLAVSLRNEPVATPLTMGELTRLRDDLAKCWSPPDGWTDPSQVRVVLLISFNIDGTVDGTPSVLESPAGKFAKAAPASAIRAIARCGPFDLPAEKYATWRQVKITFDPRDAPQP